MIQLMVFFGPPPSELGASYFFGIWCCTYKNPVVNQKNTLTLVPHSLIILGIQHENVYSWFWKHMWLSGGASHRLCSLGQVTLFL